MDVIISDKVSMFSIPHLLYIVFSLVVFVILYIIMSKRSNKARRIFLFVLALLGLCAYLSNPVYSLLTETEVDIIPLLPISLCGFCFIAGIIFVRCKISQIRSFIGFGSLFCGLYGLLVLPEFVTNVTLLTVSTILYFIPYIFAFMLGGYSFLFGIVNPSIKQLWSFSVGLISLTTLVHVINKLLVLKGVSTANYFYTLEPNRDEIMAKVFNDIFPAQFAYLAVYFVAIVVVSGIVSLFSLASKFEFVNDLPKEEYVEQNPIDGIDDEMQDNKKEFEQDSLIKDADDKVSLYNEVEKNNDENNVVESQQVKINESEGSPLSFGDADEAEIINFEEKNKTPETNDEFIIKDEENNNQENNNLDDNIIIEDEPQVENNNLQNSFNWINDVEKPKIENDLFKDEDKVSNDGIELDDIKFASDTKDNTVEEFKPEESNIEQVKTDEQHLNEDVLENKTIDNNKIQTKDIDLDEQNVEKNDIEKEPSAERDVDIEDVKDEEGKTTISSSRQESINRMKKIDSIASMADRLSTINKLRNRVDKLGK